MCETNLCLFIKVFGATREKLKIEKVDKQTSDRVAFERSPVMDSII